IGRDTALSKSSWRRRCAPSARRREPYTTTFCVSYLTGNPHARRSRDPPRRFRTVAKPRNRSQRTTQGAAEAVMGRPARRESSRGGAVISKADSAQNGNPLDEQREGGVEERMLYGETPIPRPDRQQSEETHHRPFERSARRTAPAPQQGPCDGPRSGCPGLVFSSS